MGSQEKVLEGVTEMMAMFAKSISLSLKTDVSFDGIGSARKFVDGLESHFSMSGLNAGQQLIVARNALKGSAKLWYDNVGAPGIANFQQLKAKLLELYPEIVDRVALEAEIYGVKQKFGESAASFTLHKISLLKKFGTKYNEATEIETVIARLLPEIQDVLDIAKPASVDAKW